MANKSFVILQGWILAETFDETTYTYTYDNVGNILTANGHTYTYGDSSWGDLLTGYDGKTITYDAIGNPLSDGTWTYTWEHGRELASMSNGSTTWSMTYNADGLRTKRTNGSTTYSYIYNGSSLSQMTVGSNTLRFAYDATGTPMSVTYNGTNYYYVTNIQGDITAILNTSGTTVVQYTYDAWGNILTTTGSMASTLGETNPLRYRGYVYDRETSLYYINSRYFDPSVGRFVSADVLISTGQGLLGNNMYAYCRNNPVCRIDITGYADEEADLDGETKDDLFPDPKGGDGNGQPVVGNGNGSSSNPYIGGTYSPGQYYPNNPTTNPQYQPPSGGGGVTSSTNVNGVQVDFSHGGRHIDPNAYNFMDLQEVIAHDAVQQAGYHSSGGYVQIMYDGYPVNYSFFLRDSNHINIGTYYFAVDIR